jgi:hypothetical protein
VNAQESEGSRSARNLAKGNTAEGDGVNRQSIPIDQLRGANWRAIEALPKISAMPLVVVSSSSGDHIAVPNFGLPPVRIG